MTLRLMLNTFVALVRAYSITDNSKTLFVAVYKLELK